MTTRPNPYGTRGHDRLYNNADKYETVWIFKIRPYDMVMHERALLVVSRVRWFHGDVVLDFTDGTSMPPAPLDTQMRRMIYAK